MKKINILIAKIAVNVTAFVLGVMLTSTAVAFENQAAISSFLGSKTFEIVEVGDSDEIDTEYFKSEYTNLADLTEEARLKCREAEAEGAVLLKNELINPSSRALPLLPGSRSVGLFSISSVDPVYGGTGSGAVNVSSAATFKSAMVKAGFTINEPLWDWYSANKNIYKRQRQDESNVLSPVISIRDAAWNDIPSNIKTNGSFGDAAIFVVGRVGGEGSDMKMSGFNASNPDDSTNGNYLELSPKEKTVLAGLKGEKDKGTFKRIIVLINSANQIETEFLNSSAYGIDAALWIGSVGQTGLDAVADILAGAVNPSGKLSDTFWTRHHYNPVHANMGAYTYTNSASDPKNMNRYVVYQEGIYIGYRYTETRYEDCVTGAQKAGAFDYKQVVSYPFGYGRSYTAFEYSNFSVTKPGRDYRVTLDVKNTGSLAGKEVVQIYLQKPFTDYDRQNGIEKASVELAAFTKTKLLNAGEKISVNLTVDEKYFASFDANSAKTYVVAAGRYYIAAGRDAHDALNNILAAKGYSPSNTGDKMDAAGNAALAVPFDKAFDSETYSVSGATGKDIKSLFDFADINRYEGAGTNTVNYMSRTDWQNTVKFGLSDTNQILQNHVRLTKTAKMTQDQNINNTVKDDKDYPEYGISAGINLVDMRHEVDGVPVYAYDDPLWDTFMDQLTWNETVLLLTTGLRKTVAIESIAKPETLDHNGPSGLTQPYNSMETNGLGLAVKINDPLKETYPVCYPCNGIIASSFNTALAAEVGNMIGEDALWAGFSGLYGTGCNIHRSPYQGRAFEYYSEDSFLTGIIVAYESKGIQSRGCYVYNKHCALNDQEENREGICTWANEQSIREIYLRAFEIPITLGGAKNIMSAFNRLGVVWAGASKELCTDFLRGECGLEGFIISDWWQASYMELGTAILAGSDLPDGDRPASELDKYKTGYGEVARAMRESAKRILYTVAHSNAMNGFSSSTRVIRITPGWVTAVIAIDIALGVLCAVSIAGLIFFSVTLKKN